MESFILVYFILALISIGFTLHNLSTKSYPRVESIAQSTDIISLVILTCLSIWAGFLIF